MRFFFLFVLATKTCGLFSQGTSGLGFPMFGLPIIDSIKIPHNYDHFKQVDCTFKAATRAYPECCGNLRFTSALFSSASATLSPSRTYVIKIFPINNKRVSSMDCFNFLMQQKGVILASAQGLSLLFDLKPDLFPKMKWLVSFDKMDLMKAKANPNHPVPLILCGRNNNWIFDVVDFNGGYTNAYYLLAFFEKPN